MILGMQVYEFIAGLILMVGAVAIIFLTLCQHTKGQGLSSAIMGDTSMRSGRVSHADMMLARLTSIAGVVFFIIAIAACVLCSRLG